MGIFCKNICIYQKYFVPLQPMGYKSGKINTNFIKLSLQ